MTGPVAVKPPYVEPVDVDSLIKEAITAVTQDQKFSETHADAIAAAAAEAQGRHLVLTKASAIYPRRVRWLWTQRIAIGTIALLAGREGLGKSILADTVAAMITQGMLPGECVGVPRAVLVAATEDSWSHTVVPRLMAADADRDLVYRVEIETEERHSGLVLPFDLGYVRSAAKETGAVLLILDPLISRLDDRIDSHKDAEVRLALEPLAALADEINLSVLGLIHHNKSATSDPLQAVMGSKAFAAVARSVSTVLNDPDDESGQRRLFGTPKNNLGRNDLPAMGFVINSYKIDAIDGPADTGQLAWGKDAEISIHEAMRRTQEDPDKRSAAADASEWLKAHLEAKGGRAESKLIKEAAGKEISDWAMRRAREQLKIKIERDQDFKNPKTFWVLPDFSSSGHVGSWGDSHNQRKQQQPEEKDGHGGDVGREIPQRTRTKDELLREVKIKYGYLTEEQPEGERSL